jgi:probable phosphoglycerate mutase
LTGKNIYIIRHGETDYNRHFYLQGSSINSSLNEKGNIQSIAFYDSYKHIDFDKIYTSVLKRSIESVQLFINRGIEAEQHEELNEINWGVMEGKPLDEKAMEFLNTLLTKWSENSLDEHISGGESPIDVANRQRKFLNLIYSRENEKNILISTHGRALRILICLLLNEPLSNMELYDHDNLGLYVINYNDNGKQPKIVKNNSKEHLKKL